MSKLVIDGVEIDTEVWIDAHISPFKDKKKVWAVRRANISREIADYERVLADFGTSVPSDAPGEAHTKAYLTALRQTQLELQDEPGQRFI